MAAQLASSQSPGHGSGLCGKECLSAVKPSAAAPGGSPEPQPWLCKWPTNAGLHVCTAGPSFQPWNSKWAETQRSRNAGVPPSRFLTGRGATSSSPSRRFRRPFLTHRLPPCDSLPWSPFCPPPPASQLGPSVGRQLPYLAQAASLQATQAQALLQAWVVGEVWAQIPAAPQAGQLPKLRSLLPSRGNTHSVHLLGLL